MQAPWIFSSTFLPCAGEPIDFMLDDREQAIHGTFADGVFHSRWADYDAHRVASWRESDGEQSIAVASLPKPVASGRFAIALRRMGRIFSRKSEAAPSTPLRSHARPTSVPTISVPASAQPIDSNLMSS